MDDTKTINPHVDLKKVHGIAQGDSKPENNFDLGAAFGNLDEIDPEIVHEVITRVIK